ncbi:hypothetical protein [Pararhizobium sp. O133]|uniref:hypothetical protein n=1 Tax=Pararhizobium sp. O133 TaxID=3449278 RepID=UPI003F68840D
MLNIIDYIATWDLNGGPGGVPPFGRIDLQLSGHPGVVRTPILDAATFTAIMTMLSSGSPLKYDVSNAQIIAGP